MSEPADIAASTQRFNDTARAFTPPSPTRHAKLMPLKDGVVGLQEKGASLRLIRELLATVDVAVSTDTIARFLVEVSGEPTRRREPQLSSRRRGVGATATQLRTAPVPPIDARSLQSSTPASAPHNDTPPERPRTRGPSNFCPRMSKNFAALQQAIKSGGSVLAETKLLSITIDPQNDTPAVLKDYGKAEDADPATWNFATGDPSEIDKLTHAFAVYKQSEGGTISHGLTTALIDRKGSVVKLWRGNGWTPDEVIAALQTVK